MVGARNSFRRAVGWVKTSEVHNDLGLSGGLKSALHFFVLSTASIGGEECGSVWSEQSPARCRRSRGWGHRPPPTALRPLASLCCGDEGLDLCCIFFAGGTFDTTGDIHTIGPDL